MVSGRIEEQPDITKSRGDPFRAAMMPISSTTIQNKTSALGEIAKCGLQRKTPPERGWGVW